MTGPASIALDLCNHALAVRAAGVSILPINDKTKKPLNALLPRDEEGKPVWSPFQRQIVDEATARAWFKSGAKAFAAACGAVSGGLLILDFDVDGFYERWRAEVGELADGLPVQRTGGGGYQVFCRCADPGSNEKLAWAEWETEESGRKIAIETRGEGGYAVLPPSRHPDGGTYQLLSGDLTQIPLISQARADALKNAGIKLDRCPFTRQEREKLEADARRAHAQRASKRQADGSADVIGAFNRAHCIEELLEGHGYTKVGDRYARPGRDCDSVSVKEGRSCHFSTNDPLNDGKLKSGMGVHDAFDIFTHYEHAGDVSAAVKAAALQLGLSGETTRKSSPAAVSAALEERLADQGPPVPLGETTVPPLPAGIFIDWLGQMIDAASAMTETPPDVAAIFALGTLSAATQGGWVVEPEPGYREPLCSYSLLVMESGNRKTAVQAELAAPLLAWESERQATLEKEVKQVESLRKTSEARLKKLREDAAKEKFDGRFAELSEQIAKIEAEMPEVPKVPRLFTEDVTAEHLGTMLSDNGERLAVLSDEGGIFDLMAGRYSNGLPNIEIYLKGHSASAVRVDRGTRAAVVLNRPTLTICCSPQPDVVRSLTKVKGFRGRGLLARFWYSIPASKLGFRELQSRPIPRHVKEAYARQVRRLLDAAHQESCGPVAEDPFDDGADPPPPCSEREPAVLSFSSEAWMTWKGLQRETEVQMRPGARLSEMKDWSSKFPGAVARIAGLLHLAEHASNPSASSEIAGATMARAVMLGRYLVEHAIAAFTVMGADEAMDAAKALWEVIEAGRKERFTARDAWHPLRNRVSLRNVEQAGPGFQLLLDHNYISEPPAPPDGKRGRPSRFFLVNQHIVSAWSRGEVVGVFGLIGHDSLNKSNKNSSSLVDQNDQISDAVTPKRPDQNDQKPPEDRDRRSHAGNGGRGCSPLNNEFCAPEEIERNELIPDPATPWIVTAEDAEFERLEREAMSSREFH